MDLEIITKHLEAFIKKHKTAFEELPKRQTAILELAALALSAEHYKSTGYRIEARNLKGSKFKIKISASGTPKNFSWFECLKEDWRFEIHANLPVYGAHNDQGVYVVDVAVTEADRAFLIVSSRKKIKESLAARKYPKNRALINKDLITFMEVKKLVIYPMLLAQFVGIVHEIKPKFLKGKEPDGFKIQGHFLPCLAATGYLTPNSKRIIDGYQKRKMKMLVAENFDQRFFYLRDGSGQSPLFPRSKPDAASATRLWRTGAGRRKASQK